MTAARRRTPELLAPAGDLERLEPFREGLFYVQDPAAKLSQVNLPFYPVFARILPDAACMLRRSERSDTAVFTDTRS